MCCEFFSKTHYRCVGPLGDIVESLQTGSQKIAKIKYYWYPYVKFIKIVFSDPLLKNKKKNAFFHFFPFFWCTSQRNRNFSKSFGRSTLLNILHRMSPSTTKSIFWVQPTLVELAWNDPEGLFVSAPIKHTWPPSQHSLSTFTLVRPGKFSKVLLAFPGRGNSKSTFILGPAGKTTPLATSI